MSSILEALERAEEERGGGAKRALGMAPQVEAGPRITPALILMSAVLLSALALAVWLYSGGTRQKAGVDSQPETLPIAAVAPVREEAPIALTTAPAPAKATLSVPDQLRRNALPSAKPLMNEAVVSKPSPPRPMAAPSAVRTAAAPAPTDHRVATALPGEKALVQVPSERPAISEDRRGEMSPGPVAEQEMVAPDETLLAPEVPAPVEQAAIPLVWELPQSEREKVLQLKSSVHVYSKDPAQRFVIINMHRYGEGDSLPPDGFRLDRIDQDGMIIDYGGGLVRLLRR